MLNFMIQMEMGRTCRKASPHRMGAGNNYVGPLQGKRNRGRPSTIWADYFNKLVGPHWSKVARDRNEWKVLGNQFNAVNHSRVLAQRVSLYWAFPLWGGLALNGTSNYYISSFIHSFPFWGNFPFYHLTRCKSFYFLWILYRNTDTIEWPLLTCSKQSAGACSEDNTGEDYEVQKHPVCTYRGIILH